MTRQQRPVHVVGVGMIPFTKPGASDPYTVMGARAAKLALDDAGVDYALVQQAYVGYVYGDSTAGQAAIYGVGLTLHVWHWSQWQDRAKPKAEVVPTTTYGRPLARKS